MSKYSIKDLERLTGIKAHTIRIWEQRYHLLSPDRTDTNIRTYSNEELKHLLNVSLLNKYGVKISRIAEMESNEIAREAASLLIAQTDHEDLIAGLINSMIDLDEPVFDSVIDHAVNQFGFQDTVIKVVYPFLNRIGVMWQTGTINPAQEHFVSNLVRQKFIVAINSIKLPSSSLSHTYLLFLRENELHELALLFYHYIVRSCGFKTFYLGQSVPFDDLKRVMTISKATHVITCLSNPLEESGSHYLTRLSDEFPQIEIIAFGAILTEEKITSFKNVIVPAGPEDLINRIKTS